MGEGSKLVACLSINFQGHLLPVSVSVVTFIICELLTCTCLLQVCGHQIEETLNFVAAKMDV